jgi:hypothetical protein
MSEVLQEPIRPATAAEVVDRFDVSDAARLLLREAHTPPQYFALLTKAKQFDDALRFAAEYMSPREAIWWGSLCYWQVLRQSASLGEESTAEAAPASELRVLRIVVEWVKQPDEPHRREAELAMYSAKATSIASNLALAAFYSGGNISLADQPEVAAPPSQTSRSVVAAVSMAARQVPPQLHEACLFHFLKLASEVSCGQVPWSDGLPHTTQPDQPELTNAR